MATCKAITTDAIPTYWTFCPNSAAAYVFTVILGLTAIVHIAQAIIYKKGYCWVIIVSALAQFLCYVFRILSIIYPSAFSYYAGWFILILVAPLFTNAFVYMTMGRMVWNYVDEAKVFGISASRFGTYFVILDMVAFAIQLAGAATAVGTDKPAADVLRSLHIYMGGVGVQQLFIIGFFVYAIKFHTIVLAQAKRDDAPAPPRVLRLLYILYAVLILISIRIIFRLIEYSQGLDSRIPNEEVYQYCLDSLPMLIALVLLNVTHPGALMRGREGDIPSRKERKQLGGKKHMEGTSQMGSE